MSKYPIKRIRTIALVGQGIFQFLAATQTPIALIVLEDKGDRVGDLPGMWQKPLLPPSAVVPGIPASLDALVLSLLSVNPFARPGSAAEVVDRGAKAERRTEAVQRERV